MRVTETKMNFAPKKIYFAALCGAFFYMGVVIYAQIHEMLLKLSNMRIFEQHFVYLSNILHRR